VPARRVAARTKNAASTPVFAIGLVTLAALLSCYPFVAPGHPTSQDVWPHLARQNLVYHAVKEGFSPFYTFMFYSGFPALRFYSPLLYFLGGPLTLLTAGNLLLATRILLVLLHLLSALAMYKYLRARAERHRSREGGAEFGAALGAIVYLVVPWRTLYLSNLGNYPQALVYLFLPLAFLALENTVAGRDRRGAGLLSQGLLLGLWVGLLFLSHLVYALFTLVLLVVWCLASNPRQVLREWRALVAAALAGIGVSAFFLVPFVVEQGSHRFPIAHLDLGVPDWRVLLGLKPMAGGYAGDYLGLSVVLLLGIGIGAGLLSRRFRSQVPALAGLTVSLLLTFGPALLKDKQYLITAGLPPQRFLVFVVFFTAILVPTAYELGRSLLARRGVGRGEVFAVMAGAVMLDCLIAVICARCLFRPRSDLFPLHLGRFPDPQVFLAVRDQIYPAVRGEPHARLLDLNVRSPKIDDSRRTGLLPTVGVIYGGLPTPLGLPYHQYAPRSMSYVYPWTDYIAKDLGATDSQPVSENTHKALALMGASHLTTLTAQLNTGGSSNGPFALLLKPGMDWDERFVTAERVPPLAVGRTHQGLVLAANRVVPMPPDTLVTDRSFIVTRSWRRLLDTLQLDAAALSLNFIPVLPGTSPDSLPGLPAVVIENTRIRHQDVVTGFKVNSACFLRVAVSYYPELVFILDGKPVPFHETADHFTYIRCPAGSHVLTVKARLGWLRAVTLLLSLVSLPLIVILVLRRSPRPKV
jgi:hypothetical protein